MSEFYTLYGESETQKKYEFYTNKTSDSNRILFRIHKYKHRLFTIHFKDRLNGKTVVF